jgi:hypothetical protein
MSYYISLSFVSIWHIAGCFNYEFERRETPRSFPMIWWIYVPPG